MADDAYNKKNIDRILSTKRKINIERVQVELVGTPFQLKVWKALMQIPCGTTMTYGEIAKKIGVPNAARAVGSACGKNTLAVVVPCHRAVPSTFAQDGKVGAYRWGTKRKEAMLKWEGAL
ncbi:MAG: regulatory protein / Methylated-DNA--protein-cysteine methyltransferase [Candidatus Adlerbacteria bacterium]|nr:regulatory protein / Methylated-DNA--protein-cysteine methyltransferase [Candidatus Adlerbacteria bacterium]